MSYKIRSGDKLYSKINIVIKVYLIMTLCKNTILNDLVQCTDFNKLYLIMPHNYEGMKFEDLKNTSETAGSINHC